MRCNFISNYHRHSFYSYLDMFYHKIAVSERFDNKKMAKFWPFWPLIDVKSQIVGMVSKTNLL